MLTDTAETLKVSHEIQATLSAIAIYIGTYLFGDSKNNIPPLPEKYMKEILSSTLGSTCEIIDFLSIKKSQNTASLECGINGKKITLQIALKTSENNINKYSQPQDNQSINPFYLPGIDLWKAPQIGPELEKMREDIKKNGLKNFEIVKQDRELMNKFFHDKSFEKYFIEIYRYKNGTIPFEIIKKTAGYIEDVKLFLNKPNKWCCPTFFVPEDDEHFYELNLVPFGYHSARFLLEHKLFSTRLTVEILNKLEKIAFENETGIFDHGHLHCANILFKLSKHNTIQDIKIIDWKFLQLLSLNSPQDTDKKNIPENILIETDNFLVTVMPMRALLDSPSRPKDKKDDKYADYRALLNDTERLGAIQAVISDFDGVDRDHNEEIMTDKILFLKKELSEKGILCGTLTGNSRKDLLIKFGGYLRAGGLVGRKKYILLTDTGGIGNFIDKHGNLNPFKGYTEAPVIDEKTILELKQITFDSIHKLCEEENLNETEITKIMFFVKNPTGLSIRAQIKNSILTNNYHKISKIINNILKEKSKTNKKFSSITSVHSIGAVDLITKTKGEALIELIKLMKLNRVLIMGDSIGTEKYPANDRSFLALTQEDLKKTGIEWKVDIIKIYAGKEKNAEFPRSLIKAELGEKETDVAHTVYTAIKDAREKYRLKTLQDIVAKEKLKSDTVLDLPDNFQIGILKKIIEKRYNEIKNDDSHDKTICSIKINGQNYLLNANNVTRGEKNLLLIEKENTDTNVGQESPLDITDKLKDASIVLKALGYEYEMLFSPNSADNADSPFRIQITKNKSDIRNKIEQNKVTRDYLVNNDGVSESVITGSNINTKEFKASMPDNFFKEIQYDIDKLIHSEKMKCNLLFYLNNTCNFTAFLSIDDNRIPHLAEYFKTQLMVKIQKQRIDLNLPLYPEQVSPDIIASSLENNIDKWMAGSNAFRRAHLHSVIKHFHYLVNKNFEGFYETLRNDVVISKTSDKQEYYNLLNKLTNVYESLTNKEKSELYLGIILHDFGYTLSPSGFRHWDTGSELSEPFLKALGLTDAKIITNVKDIIRAHQKLNDLGTEWLINEFENMPRILKKQLLIMSALDSAGKVTRDNVFTPDNILSTQGLSELFDFYKLLESYDTPKNTSPLNSFLEFRLNMAGINRPFQTSRKGLELSQEEFTKLKILAFSDELFKKVWSTNLQLHVFPLFMLLKKKNLSDYAERVFKLMKIIAYTTDIYLAKTGKKLTLDIEVDGDDFSDTFFESILDGLEQLFAMKNEEISHEAISKELTRSSWSNVFGLGIRFDGDKLYLSPSENKNAAPEEKTLTSDKKLSSLNDTEKLLSNLIALAWQAKQTDKKLIIGLEKEWLLPDKKNILHVNAVSSFIAALKGIEHKLRNMGFDNFEIIHENSKTLSSTLLKKASSETIFPKMIVIARKETLDLPLFDAIRSTEHEHKAFLAAINTNPKLKINSNKEEYLEIDFIEIINFSLELACGLAINIEKLKIKYTYDRLLMTVTIIPNATIVKYENLIKNMKSKTLSLQAA
ncbi:hypothetical protein OMAG_002925 [Candidatus Omnitrophus magneticus]|uniref:Uncharacterized protein n=1 Tax=Candidatus Omnitrophus magneticus TaxID=1609969 RepID=A0A0F0CP12_9BACT|nr:hypothetical protein OMAG_002925 [Candidatus Omnitrophus magneticus]